MYLPASTQYGPTPDRQSSTRASANSTAVRPTPKTRATTHHITLLVATSIEVPSLLHCSHLSIPPLDDGSRQPALPRSITADRLPTTIFFPPVPPHTPRRPGFQTRGPPEEGPQIFSSHASPRPSKRDESHSHAPGSPHLFGAATQSPGRVFTIRQIRAALACQFPLVLRHRSWIEA